MKNVHLEGEERVGKSYEDRRLVKLSHHHVYQPTSVVQINLLSFAITICTVVTDTRCQSIICEI